MKRELSRRSFLGGIGVALAQAQGGGRGQRGQDQGGRGGPSAPAGPQLPLRTTGLEHFGMVVPDVEKAARFYGPVFNPELHKEANEPLRYYVSMGIGYIAIGNN